MIYTSRYSNKELRNDGYYAVGISVGKPKFALGYELREQCYTLAPRYNMLKLGIEPYKEAYYKKLNETGSDNVVRLVRKLEEEAKEEGKALVLLCFEDIRKEGQWCHRRLFAEWWFDKVGEEIRELDDPSSAAQAKPTSSTISKAMPEEEQAEQLSLFL